MPGYKQTTKYNKRRKHVFSGVRKQEITTSELAGDVPVSENSCSPAKKNRSLDKITRNCPLDESANSHVLTRNMRFELGLLSNQKDVVKFHSNKIIDSTLL